MNCPDCRRTIEVRKSLRRGKSAIPDECPECGAALQEKSGSLLEK